MRDNFEILKAILRAQIAIEDHGDPDKALSELAGISDEQATGKILQRLNWAKQELESGDVEIACDVYLNEALELAMDAEVKKELVVKSESPFTDDLKRRFASH